jgi:hypothetical protein
MEFPPVAIRPAGISAGSLIGVLKAPGQGYRSALQTASETLVKLKS